jgi:FkbM family methyltransferase
MAWGKAKVKWLLEKLVSRPRFNDSLLYHLYLNIRYPGYSKRKRLEKQFYQSTLEAVDATLVFDVGANCGEKTAVFASLVDEVVSIEPSPTAVRVLKDRFLHNPRVAVIAGGVGSEEGTGKFHIFGDADCFNTFSLKWAQELAPINSASSISNRPSKNATLIADIPLMTLDNLISKHGVPSYIKIDVEGYELPVIKGLTATVPLLSFECNLPEFASETIECLAVLAERSPSAQFNYCIEDPPIRFECDKWLTHDEMAKLVAQQGQRFMEIYCKS